MTTETTKLKAKLKFLDSSLSTLEDTLAPLFTQTLPETTVALTPIEQAKLQTLLPYIVYDLVFIYLKAKGIDPKSHPVVSELSRIKKYFDKISNAENPETQRAPLDKAAATRFIKHAIAQSTIGDTTPASAEAGPSSFVPAKVTSKMVERRKYEAEQRARGDASSSEEELEIIGEGDDVPAADVPPAASSLSAKGKGKAKETATPDEPVQTAAGRKRRRPAIDPFAGFGDDEPTSASKEEEAEDESESRKKRKKEKKKAKKGDADDGSKGPKKSRKVDK